MAKVHCLSVLDTLVSFCLLRMVVYQLFVSSVIVNFIIFFYYDGQLTTVTTLKYYNVMPCQCSHTNEKPLNLLFSLTKQGDDDLLYEIRAV